MQLGALKRIAANQRAQIYRKTTRCRYWRNKIPKAAEFAIAKLTYKCSMKNEKKKLISNVGLKGKKERSEALETIRQK
jgi:hypothetical protein